VLTKVEELGWKFDTFVSDDLTHICILPKTTTTTQLHLIKAKQNRQF
jgi:hypothetical protein